MKPNFFPHPRIYSTNKDLMSERVVKTIHLKPGSQLRVMRNGKTYYVATKEYNEAAKAAKEARERMVNRTGELVPGFVKTRRSCYKLLKSILAYGRERKACQNGSEQKEQTIQSQPELVKA